MKVDISNILILYSIWDAILHIGFDSTELKTDILEGPLIVSRRGSDVKLTCAINYSPPGDPSSSHVLWSRDGKLLNYDNSGRWFVWTEATKLRRKILSRHNHNNVIKEGESSSSSTGRLHDLSEHLNDQSREQDMEQQELDEVEENGLLSHLLIKSIDVDKTGNYSCQLHAPTIDSSSRSEDGSSATTAHVQVHVLNGQTNPAAIRGGNNTLSRLSVVSSSSSQLMTFEKTLFNYSTCHLHHLSLLLVYILQVFAIS